MSLEVLKMYVRERGIADVQNDVGVPEVDEQVWDLENGLRTIERMERASKFLDCLEIVGVDNWPGYGDAWAMYDGEEDE